MTSEQEAQEALKALLWELPAEFGSDPDRVKTRESFHVIKGTNVRKVHKALWTLQRYFEETT